MPVTPKSSKFDSPFLDIEPGAWRAIGRMEKVNALVHPPQYLSALANAGRTEIAKTLIVSNKLFVI